MRLEMSGNYLNGEFAKENDVTKLKILDEPKMVSTEFGEKLQCRVQCNDSNDSQRIWSINKTSQNRLIKLFGNESKEWVGKEVGIEVSKTSTNVGMKDVIFVQN